MPARRFLAPQARAGNGLGYLTQPTRQLTASVIADEQRLIDRIREATNIADEPECIGPAIVDGYAEVADFHRSQQHIKAVAAARVLRPLLDTENRIRDAERRAKHAHHNLSGEFHILRKMLERAHKGGRQTPKAALVKLEQIEAKLDGVPLAA